MEALFSPALASFEAWIFLLCIIVFLGIYLFDGITLLQRVIVALRPPKKSLEATPLATEEISEITSPLLEPIAPEEVEVHEAEKKAAEEVYEQEIRQAELLEEKLTEEVHAELAAEEQSESLEEAIETEVREDMADSTLSEDTTESTEAIEANNNEEES